LKPEFFAVISPSHFTPAIVKECGTVWAARNLIPFMQGSKESPWSRYEYLRYHVGLVQPPNSRICLFVQSLFGRRGSR
jgi:hypothetical protein